MKKLLSALLFAWCGLVVAEPWSFALIGDTPYSDHEREQLPRILESIADAGVALTIHVGDFKHGQGRCDDAVFDDRKQLFDSSRMPFIYVPGDNDWMDCSRVSNGSYDPMERLSRLRKLFFADKHSLGQRRIKVQQQSAAYPEHLRFRQGPVLFVTLNVPGDDNDYGRGNKPTAEFEARTPVVQAWLKEGFALARKEKLRGIVIALQANPGFKQFNQGMPHPGFKLLLDALHAESQSFDGQVLFLHGDTHSHQINQPFIAANGEPLRNFTRVESYGFPFLGWVKITVDVDSRELFRFESFPWQP